VDIDVDLTAPELLGVVSAAVIALAAFLPWMRDIFHGLTANPSMVSIEGLGQLTLLLGLVAVAAVLLFEWDDRGAYVLLATGLLAEVVAVWQFTTIDSPAVPVEGLYLTLFAGLGLLVAGAAGYLTPYPYDVSRHPAYARWSRPSASRRTSANLSASAGWPTAGSTGRRRGVGRRRTDTG
jgi:hypothetical protein